MSQKVRSEANVIVIRVSSTIRRLGTELQQVMFREKNYVRVSKHWELQGVVLRGRQSELKK